MLKKFIFSVLAVCSVLFAGSDVIQLPSTFPSHWIQVSSDQFVIGTSLNNFNIRFMNPDGSATHNGRNLYADINVSNPAFNHMLATALAAQAKGKIICTMALKPNCTDIVCYDLISIDIVY